MRGRPEPSKKQRRESENHIALGGMRSPHFSVPRIAHACDAGSFIATLITEVIDGNPRLTEPVLAILEGRPSEGFLSTDVSQLKAYVADQLSAEPPQEKAGLDPTAFRMWTNSSGDPDTDLAGWLETGAPLGIIHPVTSRGIFPPVDVIVPTDGSIAALASTPEGWSNYRSSEEDPSTTAMLLQNMVDKGWALSHTSWGSLTSALSSKDITLNKLALLSKVKPNGDIKHRLVWDLLRSTVNSVVQQGERVVLPRVSDLVKDAWDLSQNAPSDCPLWLFGTDISDAFHQVPLHPDEWRFTAAAFQGKFFVFKVLVFGSASAPTVWGRFAAFAGRSTSAIVNKLGVRMQMYVDDPVFVASGTIQQATIGITTALLWLNILGLPLAWNKSDGGRSITWIGARMLSSPGTLTVTIPEDKIQDLITSITEVLDQGVSSRRTLRSITGKLSFVAGLVPQLRPFLSPLWAVSAGNATHDGTSHGAPAPGGPSRTDGLPHHLFHVSRVKGALHWALALLRKEAGALVRVHPLTPTPAHLILGLTTDASPWGLGAVLTRMGTPIAWMADKIHPVDLDRFSATLGDSAFTTTWEALTILVAIRAWTPMFPPGTRFALRSDSLGALSSIAKSASPSKGLSLILQEIALDEAGQVWGFDSLTHIPGVSNTIADPLSRLFAPNAKPIPDSLTTVPRTIVAHRVGTWWATTARQPR
jgi:hypothetical protein